MKQELLNRFLDYVSIDTQSDENSKTIPSTKKQFDLANRLVDELTAMGVADVVLDSKCYVYAKLPANLPDGHPLKENPPKVGFIAHLDTAPATTGKNVNPQIVGAYPGGDIKISPTLTLTPKENPALNDAVDHTLITTDGTTLLGADDKAGIAIIMTALNRIIKNPDILHPELRVAFTPDEEIGKGARHFNLKKFDADAAYTVDGGPAGEINRETFSADSAEISIKGRETHPGEAKGILINALKIASFIISELPQSLAPETTSKRQPFIHPYIFEGSVADARIKCLLRGFDLKDLARQKIILEEIGKRTRKKWPKAVVDLNFSQTYRNMKEVLETVPHVTDHLEAAVRRAGLEPRWIPVRGGTDGSGLTEMGLPCPNIFTGGHNYHGPSEWISLDIMEKSVQTVVNLAQIWVNE